MHVLLGHFRHSCACQFVKQDPPTLFLMAVVPPVGQCILSHCKNFSGTSHGMLQRDHCVNMASEFPRSLSDWAFVGFTEATSQPPRLKATTTNILVPDSTGHPQKSWVHASTCHSCLMKWEELSQYQSGGFNVVADWCVIVRNAWNWVRPSQEQGSQKTLSYLPSP